MAYIKIDGFLCERCLAPLGTEAAQHTGAKELPQVQKSLLEQTAYDASPRQPGLAKGQLPTSSSLNRGQSR